MRRFVTKAAGLFGPGPMPRQEPLAAPRRIRKGKALAGVLVATMLGCDQLPPPFAAPQMGDPTGIGSETAVQQRLWSPHMLTRAAGIGTCEVGQVRRPAFGCNESERFFEGPLRTAAAGTLRIRTKRPEVLQTSYGLIEGQIEIPEIMDWIPLPPFLVPPGTDRINRKVQNERVKDKRHQAILRVRPMLSSPAIWRTRPVWPLASSQLTFDLAIMPEAIRAGARSSRVKVFAQVGTAPRKLLFQKIIDNKQPAEWQSHTIPLAAFAGQPTALVFEAEPWPRAQGGFSAPLIGAPLLTYRTTAPTEPKNILLISLDTLRGDHVGATRDGRDLTPNLDFFAAQGAVFEQAMTTYPSTTASHMSLMTGLYPIAHNTDHPGVTLSTEIPTMAEILAEGGFATAAVTENAMLAASAGFSRGFDFYREERDLGISEAQGHIEKTFAAGTKWLEEHKDERFFLFLHTYQVHGPYRPPPEYDVFKSDLTGTKKDSLARRAITQINAYAGEVLYTDAIVGKLLHKIETLGLAENTIIIITSDHGEEFGLHGHIGHSQTPFESVMRVPLLIRAPGKFKPGIKIDPVVSLVDILPTVLEMAVPPTAASAPTGRRWHGVSLLGLLRGTSKPAREAVFAESRRPGFQSVVARTNSHRYITYEDPAAAPRIYDLRTDLAEQNNLLTPELRKKGQRLAQRYQLWRNDARKRAVSIREAGSVDPETAAKLRALGYTD